MQQDTSARSAREIIAAHDQMHRAEAAIDAIHAPLPDEYVTATMGSDAWYGDPDDVPIADSPEDVTTRTIPLDGGTAIVEHVDGRVEVSIRLGDRIVAALALSPGEADVIGQALSRPHGPTADDYWLMMDTVAGAR